MTREEFIRRSLRSEARFIDAAMEDRGTQTISIGPWRCECGYEERSAAKMWDHRCPITATQNTAFTNTTREESPTPTPVLKAAAR